jgi:hypothetical protein
VFECESWLFRWWWIRGQDPIHFSERFVATLRQVHDELMFGLYVYCSSFSLVSSISLNFLVHVQVPVSWDSSFNCYLHIQVPVNPDVQFGSYVQVPMSKCWPHLLGFTGKSKWFKFVRFRRKLLFIQDSNSLFMDSCEIFEFLVLIALVECFYSPLCLFGF